MTGLESILSDFLAEHGKDDVRTSNKSMIVLLHGTGGRPDGNWFPWLKKRLEAQKCQVFVPTLPTPAGQNLKSWLRAYDEQVPGIGPNTILVGHSMGAGFALRLLERASEAIAATFLVSAWEGLLNNPAFDPHIESFFREPLAYETISQNAGRIKAYHGDNDPYVPLEMGRTLAEKLGAEFQVVPNGGHLNTESRTLSLPSLLEDILAQIASSEGSSSETRQDDSE